MGMVSTPGERTFRTQHLPRNRQDRDLRHAGWMDELSAVAARRGAFSRRAGAPAQGGGSVKAAVPRTGIRIPSAWVASPSRTRAGPSPLWAIVIWVLRLPVRRFAAFWRLAK